MPETDTIAYLITTHSPDDISPGYRKIAGDIVAVDGGLQKVHDLGLIPKIIIGDFDSITQDLLQLYADTPKIRFQSAKNETDTELALAWCAQEGYGSVVICNDMQGRFDHSAAIIQNLIDLRGKGIACKIDTGRQSIYFLDHKTRIQGKKGDLLSLIAYSDQIHLIDSENLLYSLKDLVIAQHQSRGISNVLTQDEATINLKSGLALAIHTYKRSK
nr:thiamine pyrophosphokinae [Candidatus Cloacimonadota bacterium]